MEQFGAREPARARPGEPAGSCAPIPWNEVRVGYWEAHASAASGVGTRQTPAVFVGTTRTTRGTARHPPRAGRVRRQDRCGLASRPAERFTEEGDYTGSTAGVCSAGWQVPDKRRARRVTTNSVSDLEVPGGLTNSALPTAFPDQVGADPHPDYLYPVRARRGSNLDEQRVIVQPDRLTTFGEE